MVLIFNHGFKHDRSQSAKGFYLSLLTTNPEIFPDEETQKSDFINQVICEDLKILAAATNFKTIRKDGLKVHLDF